MSHFLNFRYFWEILKSYIWINRIRITEGKLQTTIIDTIKKLREEGKVEVYQSVKYTTSNEQMRKFLRRGTLQKVIKQYDREKGASVSTDLS